MATYPYISGAGNVSQMITQLRKSFPATITADTVKKLGIAPNNESYVLNALQFLKIIDLEGKKTSESAKVFAHHKDEDFAKSFSSLVEKAYEGLFELHGNSTWELKNDELITFFRQSDQTSSIIGSRQAGLFRVLSALSGYGEIPETKSKKTTKTANNEKYSKPEKSKKGTASLDIKHHSSLNNQSISSASKNNINNGESNQLGLTVRIEINLPADGSKETYDNIFKSIKENLLGG